MEINSDYSIFDFVSLQQSNMEQLAEGALTNAIDLYADGKYEKAIQEFQRSIAMSPYNENVIETYDYMANAYLQLGDSRGAEKAYKMAISLDPQREDVYLNLGNLYYDEKKFDQAKKAYENSVSVYPSSETYYSLAHCCLGMENTDDAAQYFKKVISMEPESAEGYYGLGMTYAKEGEYEKATKQFEKALELDTDFDDARVELGYALADMGDMDGANKQYEILDKNESSLSSLLYAYMYKVEKPKFAAANNGNFNWDLSIRTSVSVLDNYLSEADTEKYFTVKFKFSKEMDISSVQDVENWDISRAKGYGPYAYNFGLKTPENEVEIANRPANVLYDPSTQTASVTFAIEQNDQADGTIDPGHIVFSFSGTDKFGFGMDDAYDSFSGFNGFA